jgi:hypothetical protein
MLQENPYAELTTPELKKILKERGEKVSSLQLSSSPSSSPLLLSLVKW